MKIINTMIGILLGGGLAYSACAASISFLPVSKIGNDEVIINLLLPPLAKKYKCDLKNLKSGIKRQQSECHFPMDFKNLKPGSYSFKVTAIGARNKNIANGTLLFDISAPTVILDDQYFLNTKIKGVNLAGAEFGSVLPGIVGTNYTYPTTKEIDYFLSKKMNVFRIPFRWERLQRSLFSDLDSNELKLLDQVVNDITLKGAYAVIDPHNYARYNNILIGQGEVSYEAFSDFWGRVAMHYKDNPKVIFDLGNEPYNIDAQSVADYSNMAIRTIRNLGIKNFILVEGTYWSSGSAWVMSHNAEAMKNIVDPIHNFAFEIHQYLDSAASGTIGECVSSTIGSTRLSEVTKWAKDFNKKLWLGEYAFTPSNLCMQAGDDLLRFLELHDDVWIGSAYWAAGPWWSETNTSVIEPSNNVDRPQMSVLEKYL